MAVTRTDDCDDRAPMLDDDDYYGPGRRSWGFRH